jgi:hypothetical protein
MGRILDLWKSFEDAFIAPDAGDAQREDMRLAFFSGALALSSVARSISKIPEDERGLAQADLVIELERFRIDLLTQHVMASMRYSTEDLRAMRQKG